MAAEKKRAHRTLARSRRAIWQIVVVVAIVLVTKTVAAEAYYVPSGSMLPSLLIGDQLLVSKFPYGYSRYSLPVPLAPASHERLLGNLPRAATSWCSACRATRSQTYVKRVVGLPGDRVQMRGGRLVLNGETLPLRRDGVGEIEDENGCARPRRATSRRCRAGASTRSSSRAGTAISITRRCSPSRRARSSCLAIIATTRSTAACRRWRAASVSCRWKILSAASRRVLGSWDLSLRHDAALDAGRPACASRAFFSRVH